VADINRNIRTSYNNERFEVFYGSDYEEWRLLGC
jgi:hypothetical protein